ncbi:hypothetical protein F6Y03_30440 [Bacillus megaterium]|nr:hypothetical protein [Priestia megaterium]
MNFGFASAHRLFVSISTDSGLTASKPFFHFKPLTAATAIPAAIKHAPKSARAVSGSFISSQLLGGSGQGMRRHR